MGVYSTTYADATLGGFCILCVLKELIVDPATCQQESGAVIPLKILNNLELSE